MKKKRMIAVMLTAAMAATMFTGCKTKAPESESTESKTDSGKKVLTFNTNSWAAPQNVPGLQELFDQWEEENNAELEITIGTDDYLPKLLQDINADNVADICMVDGSNLAEVDKTGAMVSLDPWFTEEKRAEHYPYAAE